jgi:hypothetical protein
VLDPDHENVLITSEQITAALNSNNYELALGLISEVYRAQNLTPRMNLINQVLTGRLIAKYMQARNTNERVAIADNQIKFHDGASALKLYQLVAKYPRLLNLRNVSATDLKRFGSDIEAMVLNFQSFALYLRRPSPLISCCIGINFAPMQHHEVNFPILDDTGVNHLANVQTDSVALNQYLGEPFSFQSFTIAVILELSH